MSKITNKIIEVLFDKVWGKIIMPIIDSLIFYYLAFTSKHSILHDPAVLFVASIIVIAATLAAMTYIQNFLEKRKQMRQITQSAPPESYLEITVVNGTVTLSNSPNILISWGFKDISKLDNTSFSRATCFVQFDIPFSISDSPIIDVKAKNGEIFLQEKLGIMEHSYFFVNEKIHCALVVVWGNISVENGKYVIFFKKKPRLSQN